MNPTYKNLRDLPGAPAGTVWSQPDGRARYYPNGDRNSEMEFTEEFIRFHTDFFELVQPESLEDAVKKLLDRNPSQCCNPHNGHIDCDDDCYGKIIDNLRTVFNRIKQEGK